MAERKPTVDAYIARSAPFAQPILEHLRELVHATCPEMHEAVKWSMPFFLHRDTILCNMAAFRTHCSFGFWDRSMAPQLEALGVLSGAAMGSLGRIRSVADLPDDGTMRALIGRAAELARAERTAPVRVVKPPRPELETPAELLWALHAHAGAEERFATMSPSCRREYVEWILEAKREETRARRVTDAAARIAAGKSRQWEFRSLTKLG